MCIVVVSNENSSYVPLADKRSAPRGVSSRGFLICLFILRAKDTAEASSVYDWGGDKVFGWLERVVTEF